MGGKMGKIEKHAFLKAFYIQCNNNKLGTSERGEVKNKQSKVVKDCFSLKRLVVVVVRP